MAQTKAKKKRAIEAKKKNGILKMNHGHKDSQNQYQLHYIGAGGIRAIDYFDTEKDLRSWAKAMNKELMKDKNSNKVILERNVVMPKNFSVYTKNYLTPTKLYNGKVLQ